MAEDNQSNEKPLISNCDPDEQEPTQIESMCMNCGQNGTTTLLLTKIPFFKDIVVMAFSCPHCGFRNNEVQSAGAIQDKGLRITCTVNSAEDLNRQIVKSDTTVIQVPELELEVPSVTQKGVLNTIEGFLSATGDALKDVVARLKEQENKDEEQIAKLEAFIAKCYSYAKGEHLPFTVIVDDPAGNCFLENPKAPNPDPNATIQHYVRTLEQNHAVGIYPELEEEEKKEEKKEGEETKEEEKKEVTPEDLKGEVMQFPSRCSACQRDVMVNMCMINIPYFKEIVMMAATCDHCGYKSTEVKGGGAIPPKGKKISLKVTNVEDLSRDVLKSETASVEIPEIRLELTAGTLGGKFTTIEGLIDIVKTELGNNPFIGGDSSHEDRNAKFEKFISDIDDLLNVRKEWTLKIIDPLANSYIQNIYAPDPDPNMQIEEYERSFEENEELGINDMKTENY